MENASDHCAYLDEDDQKAMDLFIEHFDRQINRGIHTFKLKAEKYSGQPEFDKYNVASLMLLNSGISFLGIGDSYKPINLQSKDVTALFRVCFEGIVNSTFVAASEPEVARKAMRHARYAPFRLHGSETQLGSRTLTLRHGGLPEDFAELREEFTTKRGRNVGWTDFSVRQRIDKTAEKYGDRIQLTLGQAYFGFYGTASELMHSSLYGALMFIDSRSREEFLGNMKRLVWTSLIECGVSVLGLLDVLKAETGIERFEEASNNSAQIIESAIEAL